MPSGIDTNYGINYQNMVGVLRVIEFIKGDQILSIEFESKDDELEDINIEYTGYFIFEQVKKKEHSVWNKSSLIPILTKFIQEDEKNLSGKEIKFRFTTQSGWNAEITELLQIQQNLQNNLEISNADKGRINSLFKGKFTDQKKIEVFKKIEFVWNYFAPNHPSSPFDNIKSKCLEELSKYNILIRNPKQIFQDIIEQIITKSSSQMRTKYTAKDFEEISGIPAFSDDFKYLQEKIGQSFLNVIQEFNPIFIRKEIKITNSQNESITIPIYIELNNLKIGLWIVDMHLPSEEVDEINFAFTSFIDITHFIILNNSNQYYDEIRYNFKNVVIVDNSEELKSKIKEIVR